MHVTCLWAADSTNFAPEMAGITVFGQLVPQIYCGIAAELIVFGCGFRRGFLEGQYNNYIIIKYIYSFLLAFIVFAVVKHHALLHTLPTPITYKAHSPLHWYWLY